MPCPDAAVVSQRPQRRDSLVRAHGQLPGHHPHHHDIGIIDPRFPQSTRMRCTEPKEWLLPVGVLGDFSGTSGRISQHEHETTERAFMQLNGLRQQDPAGHGVDWSLPGHLRARRRSCRHVPASPRACGAGGDVAAFPLEMRAVVTASQRTKSTPTPTITRKRPQVIASPASTASSPGLSRADEAGAAAGSRRRRRSASVLPPASRLMSPIITKGTFPSS